MYKSKPAPWRTEASQKRRTGGPIKLLSKQERLTSTRQEHIEQLQLPKAESFSGGQTNDHRNQSEDVLFFHLIDSVEHQTAVNLQGYQHLLLPCHHQHP
jgi:hypothetical protein